MQEYRDEWPLLIVCPSSLRLTWCEAVTTWLPDVTYADVNVILKGNCLIDKVTILSIPSRQSVHTHILKILFVII